MRVKLLLLAAASAAAISAVAPAAVAQEQIGPKAMNNGREPNPGTPTYPMPSEQAAAPVAAGGGMTMPRSGTARSERPVRSTVGSGGGGAGGAGGSSGR